MGVPQGTKLGPILFVIHVNNIFEIQFEEGLIFEFADDIVYKEKVSSKV